MHGKLCKNDFSIQKHALRMYVNSAGNYVLYVKSLPEYMHIKVIASTYDYYNKQVDSSLSKNQAFIS